MDMVVKVVNLAHGGVAHLSTMPTLWRQILMHPTSVRIKLSRSPWAEKLPTQHQVEFRRDRELFIGRDTGASALGDDYSKTG
jgi:hypothetical protein